MILYSGAPRTTSLLVSVTCADEAAAALVGGAHVIDAKDPMSGALGMVRPEPFAEICAMVRNRVPVSAALGDAHDPGGTERLAAEYSSLGALLLKVGFAGIADPGRVERIVAAAVRGCSSGNIESGVVAVAYADAAYVGSINAHALVDIAARNGVRGMLVDTADKSGPGLTAAWTPQEIAVWVAAVRGYGLIAAVAGKLGPEDLAIVRDAGADIIGVRGAACVGGRTGSVSVDRVRQLRARLDNDSATRRFVARAESASHV